MDAKSFRKLTSRILRHGGFNTKTNKSTHEYELSLGSNDPILFCKMVNLQENDTLENYLCFRSLRPLTEEELKFYNRIIKRFTKLGPSINISFEDESQPVFTDEQIEALESLATEYNIGDIDE